VTADAELADAIRHAWDATQLVVDHRDELQQPSNALSFLRSGIQAHADRQAPDAKRECANRYEIGSIWLASADAPAAAELAEVAARLRMLTA
jgi:hypothetical protein